MLTWSRPSTSIKMTAPSRRALVTSSCRFEQIQHISLVEHQLNRTRQSVRAQNPE